MDLKLWMTNLSDVVKKIPLVLLAIPGSHDSMTYSITRSSEVAPDCAKYVKYLLKFGPFKRIAIKWSVTQTLSVTEQLHNGVRYFDLRIAKHKTDNNFYFVHGLYGSVVRERLEEILNFLITNKNEVVILDFQHFYNFLDSDHERLVDIIIDVLNTRLCPGNKNIYDLTLDWMLRNYYQVIVVYRDDHVQNLWVWPSWEYPTYWPNTTNIKKLLLYLNVTTADRESNRGMISQCLLTPDFAFVTRHLFGNLKHTCAKPCLRAVLPWIENQRVGIGEGVNVVISDFIEMQDSIFCKTVIALNYKLQEEIKRESMDIVGVHKSVNSSYTLG